MTLPITLYPPSHSASDGVNSPPTWIDSIPGERVRIRIDSRGPVGGCTMIESVAQPGVSTPLHTHREVEVFHVLEGEMTFSFGAERTKLNAGSIVVAPAGVAHQWANFTAKPLRMVVSFIPGGNEELFINFGKVANEDLVTYAKAHGTDVIGPPMSPAL